MKGNDKFNKKTGRLRFNNPATTSWERELVQAMLTCWAGVSDPALFMTAGLILIFHMHIKNNGPPAHRQTTCQTYFVGHA